MKQEFIDKFGEEIAKCLNDKGFLLRLPNMDEVEGDFKIHNKESGKWVFLPYLSHWKGGQSGEWHRTSDTVEMLSKIKQ